MGLGMRTTGVRAAGGWATGVWAACVWTGRVTVAAALCAAGGCTSPWQTGYTGKTLATASERCEVQPDAGTMPEGFELLGTSHFQWDKYEEDEAAKFGRSIGADLVLVKGQLIATNEERGSVKLYNPGQTGMSQSVGVTTSVPYVRSMEYWVCDGKFLTRVRAGAEGEGK